MCRDFYAMSDKTLCFERNVVFLTENNSKFNDDSNEVSVDNSFLWEIFSNKWTRDKKENNFSSLLFEFKRKKEETRLLIKQLILVKKIVLLLAFTFNYVNGLTNKMSSLMAYNSIIVYIIIYKTTYLLKSICLALLSI